MQDIPPRELLTSLWWAGVNAVRGDTAVRTALTRNSISRPDAILAIGKAAASMTQAAIRHFGADSPVLVVTKYGHGAGLPDHVRLIEAAHPVPDENALAAGKAMLHLVRGMAPGSHLLMLVSGGASALAELPEPGHSLQSLQAENRQMLAKGLDIHAMNTHRKTLSQIKGGKLLAEFHGTLVTTLAISDVQGDALSVIGSGIGDAPPDARFSFDPHIVACNRIARGACAHSAETQFGLKVQQNDETLYDDIRALAPMVCDRLQRGPAGLYIWGGEPTVVLPPDPGRGGRNQALALLLARDLAGRHDIDILVAGTDGTDGPTQAAGGFADGQVWSDAAQPFLRAADSGSYLETREALFSTGPTGTNVMDLLIALKR